MTDAHGTASTRNSKFIKATPVVKKVFLHVVIVMQAVADAGRVLSEVDVPL